MNVTSFVLTLPALFGAVSPVLAQSPLSPRPSNALFGPAAERPSANQGLDVAATLVQAYDDNLLAESGLVSPDVARVGGVFTMLQGSGEYKVRNRSFEFALTGGSAFRYNSHDGRIRTFSHTAGAGLAARLARRTTITLNQGLAYSPSSLFGLFTRLASPEPGDAPPAAPDYHVSDAAFRAYVTTARVTHGLTRRVSITADADYTFTDFVHEAGGRQDMRARNAGVGVSRSAGRRTDVGVRYTYRTGDMRGAGPRPPSEHVVQIGLDHHRVLSATRQAHFGLSVGLSSTDASLAAVPSDRRRFYGISGDASFAYPFGRSWQAGAAYRRGLQYVAGLTEPVVVGGLSATVSGLLTRRLDLLVTAAYSSGESAVYSASAFDTYAGTVRSRFALSESIAAYGEYLLYFYDFSAHPLLVQGLPSRLERHGLRAGLTFWMPAFRR